MGVQGRVHPGPRHPGARQTWWPHVAVVLALLVVGTASPVAAQEAPEARGIDAVCPPPPAEEEADDTEAPDDTRPLPSDLGTTHAAAIECALRYELLRGFGDGTFRPADPITRGQMATFVVAWLEAATGLPLPEAEDGGFEDSAGSVHREAIDRLTGAGVVAGRSATRFGPRDTLTRGQFTRVVANAISYADVFETGGPLPPPSDQRWFDDIEDTTFAASIRALTAVGLATGTGDGAFDPAAPVTRGQLSTFLMRAADYLDEHQRWLPTAAVVLFEGDLVAMLGTPSDPVTDEGAPDPEAAADDADPDADDPDPVGDPTDDIVLTPWVVGDVALSIYAFGGELGYAVRLEDLPGSTRTTAVVTLHLGDPADGGPVVLELADAVPALPGTVQTGTAYERDASVRLADLARAEAGLYVLVSTTDRPDGVAVARLVRTGD